MAVSLQGPLPRYRQISELLIRDIAAGRLMDGERLPPERDMAAELGIAVGTLRHALADLAAKGLLRRVQGSGNYVCAKSDPDSVYAFFRLELPEGGGLPTARVLDVTRLPKPAALPDFGTAPEAFRIRRLRFLSGRPAALEEIWLDGGYVSHLEPAMLSESLYLFYRRKLGLWIVRAEDRIDVDGVPGWTPPVFGLPAGTLAPRVTRSAWDGENRSAEVSFTWFDPAHARYVARLK